MAGITRPAFNPKRLKSHMYNKVGSTRQAGCLFRRQWLYIARHRVLLTTIAISCLFRTAYADLAASKTAIQKGNTQYRNHSYSQALTNYLAAVEADPTYALAYNNLGLVYMRLNRYSEAYSAFDHAKSASTNAYISPYLNMAKSLCRQGLLTNALAEVEAGLVITNSDILLYQKGWIEDELGQLANARVSLDASLSANPTNSLASALLGIVKAKQGQTNAAIMDFYLSINAKSDDIVSAMTAYNLQRLRSSNLVFQSQAAADAYTNGLHWMRLEHFVEAETALSVAEALDNMLPDIPYTIWLSHMLRGDYPAVASLNRANSILHPVVIRSCSGEPTVYIDGVKRGTAPVTVYLFSSEYDVSLRGVSGTQNVEWVGRDYTDGTPGGTNVMLLNPVAVSDYTAFGPVADIDKDWLADIWETRWFGGLSQGPQSNETDHDGLINLYEHWYSTSPANSDTDGDGVSDSKEVQAFGTDPTRTNTIYYVNDASRTNDNWCTSYGNNVNDGLTPATPKASVKAILAAYDLKPGDTVVIDTGIYNLTNNITIESADGGSSNGPVVFQASPYGVLSTGASWVVQADYVTLRTATSTNHPGIAQSWMQITSGEGSGTWRVGVELQGHFSRLCRLDIFGNIIGIITGYTYNQGIGSTIENCLVRDNMSGISVPGNTTITRCTIVATNDYSSALDLGDHGGVNLKNNIIVAHGLDGWAISGFIEDSDYNCIFTTNGSQINLWYPERNDGRASPGQDANSLSCDPLFVNPASGDYHLQSTAGSYHGGAWTTDGKDSPAIDIADPYSDYSKEPIPNGSCANAGAYSGTEQASKIPMNRRLWLYEPRGGESFPDPSTPVSIRWKCVGLGWQSSDKVIIEYSPDSGGSWFAIPGAEAVPAQDATYSWDISSVTPTPFCRVRVTSNTDGVATDQSKNDFRIGANLTYYVNDDFTIYDAWCTAAGNDANTGGDPAHPKATVQAILTNYNLEPGDTVAIDTGMYNLTNDITVEMADGGLSNAPVVFQASPYGVTINRNNTSSGCGWLIYADYVKLTTATNSKYPAYPQRWMAVTGGSFGVMVQGGDGCLLSRMDINSNYNYGVAYSTIGMGTRLEVENSILRGSWNPSNGSGLYVKDSDVTMRNCTVVGNRSYGIMLDHSSAIFRNNIIWADGTGAYAISRNHTDNGLDSDNNLVFATRGADVGNSGVPSATLGGWRMATGQDTNSLNCDPLFVNAEGGDFHLQSTAGSYHSGVWTSDATNSPGIDTGYGDAGAEPAPNASSMHGSNKGMRNLGAYGGTEQGSKTPPTRKLLLFSPIGGENFVNQSVPVNIRWTMVGTSWQTTDSIKLEYTADAGGTWNGIVGGPAVLATNGLYPWDISWLAGGALYRVRATCNQDGAAADRSSRNFGIGSNHVYYVNDSSTNNDAWCTAPGNDANTGTDQAHPKATVQSILTAYDLEPGEIVKIDTGTYTLTNNITVDNRHSGLNDLPVVFEASPFGVIINRNSMASDSYGWQIDAYFIILRTAKIPSGAHHWMRVTGGGVGIYLNGENCRLERLDVVDNFYQGISLYIYSSNATVENCLIRGSTSNDGTGIYIDSACVTINNCTIYGNGQYGVYFARLWADALRNCIIGVDGIGRYCIGCSSTPYSSVYSLTSDYNDLYVTNGGCVGRIDAGENYATLADWSMSTSQDTNSLNADPLFVNVTGGDYHLKSTAGSYHGGAWTADAASSPCIDVGDPVSAWTNEPLPNGSRINLGAYGNTAQASKTPVSSLPSLWITPPSLPFGLVTVNTTNQLVFTVQNTGGGSITGNVGGFSEPFSIVGGTNFVLASGMITNVNVRFAPTSVGMYSNNLAFISSAGNLLRTVTGTAVNTILRPEALGDVSFGVLSNRFGFNVNWTSGRVVVVDASTNLTQTNWIPLVTGTLSGVPYYFFDSKWTNYIGRFYRIRSQ